MGADVDVARAHFLSAFNVEAQSTCGINHVVVTTLSYLDVADDAHNSTSLKTALCAASKAAVQVVGKLLSSFCATHIRGDNNGIFPVNGLVS